MSGARADKKTDKKADKKTEVEEEVEEVSVSKSKKKSKKSKKTALESAAGGAAVQAAAVSVPEFDMDKEQAAKATIRKKQAGERQPRSVRSQRGLARHRADCGWSRWTSDACAADCNAAIRSGPAGSKPEGCRG